MKTIRCASRTGSSVRISSSSLPATEDSQKRVADGTRTRDRRDHNPELYQLSYCHRAVGIVSGSARKRVPGAPYTAGGGHGSCSCASQTSSGSSARTRSWPLVRGRRARERLPRRRRSRLAVRPSRRRPPAGPALTRRRDEAEPGQQLELAVDRLVAHPRRLDPLADRVIVLTTRVLELLPLNVDRPSGERWLSLQWSKCRCVLTTTSTPARSRPLAQRDEAGVEVGYIWVQFRHAGVDEHAAVGMVDDVDIERASARPRRAAPPLAAA